MRTVALLLVFVSVAMSSSSQSSETERILLSGNGPADAVEWDFRITEGRRAGETAKIPVPSNWEQHGFGNYDYGSVPTKDKHKEDGVYQRGFTVPENWRGRSIRIVFEGAMTDTTVTVNGRSAGPTHQGGFYQFHFDITDMVQFGADNRLEVHVSKDSANASIEEAERAADFWVFGGIYRPVWLEARPAQSIEWSAIDAQADGSLRALVHLAGEGGADRVVARVLSMTGQPVGESLEGPLRPGAPVELTGKIAGAKTWSAEEPNLYQMQITLMKGEAVVHRTIERVGFRTVETRAGQGVFVNGERITVKGVNRHCFRPESGRALDPRDSVEDVRLIKSMNMNSVRCSHYPPDKAFLDACDELGLYVENEICTWQKPALDTPSARRLIGQMIRRDVNHPSILWWANGNEGGWNTAVDGDFALWDIRKRPVLHPWEEFSGYQTKHYPVWERLQQDLAGKFLVMPTEFLHGLYDGGHGAGLEDYWNAITSRPNGVGGFLWVLADEGIMRTDRNGAIDNWGTNAPDGIVGPHHEKEASYLTIKDIFCPVRIAMKKLPPAFDGRVAVSNHYDFRNLSVVRFSWKLARFPADGTAPVSGTCAGPAVTPGASGTIDLGLPANWRTFHGLELRADDAGGNELWTWSWEIPGGGMKPPVAATAAKLSISEANDRLLVKTGEGTSFEFDQRTGLLKQVMVGGMVLPFGNGPRLALGLEGGGKPSPTASAPESPAIARRMLDSGACRIDVTSSEGMKTFTWTVHPGGLLDLEYFYQIENPTVFHGVSFDLPENEIARFSWTGQGPERVWANRMRGTRFGCFENEFRKLRPGIDYQYPHAAGYFADVRAATVGLKTGRISIIVAQADTFLRLGTNDEGQHIHTSWPTGDFSVLHAIPAIGNKFHKPGQIGPQSQAHPAAGTVGGKVTFGFSK